jgi:hypothetical protein
VFDYNFMTTWLTTDNGQTIGTLGSEEGVIVIDEEHELGARITLERDGSTAPWSITCGIYGSFVHTAFASSQSEGIQKYNLMKNDLISIMNDESSDSRHEAMHRFSETY